jgi:hypothetical protein
MARDVLFDDRQLARRARTTLAGANAGVLVTGDDRCRIVTALAAGVRDDDGEALIRCNRENALVPAARTRRLASLVLAPNPTFGVRLTLSRRLGLADGTAERTAGHGDALCRANRSVSGTTDIVVALRVDHVSAGCPRDHPLNVLVEERAVPIDLDEQLRWLAAQAIGVPRSRVAAACLTALTAERATLCWVDQSGAHPATLPFARPARTLEDLAATLRACETAATANETW